LLYRSKGETLLSSGGRITIASDGSKHSLNISNVEASDADKYTVKGFNDSGASRCTATLLVQGAIFCIVFVLFLSKLNATH